MFNLVFRHGSGPGLQMDQWRKILASNIDRLTQRDGYSKKALAKHCGVAPPQVSRWADDSENGSFPEKYLDMICGYLRVDLSELFVAEPGKPREIRPDEALAVLQKFVKKQHQN